MSARPNILLLTVDALRADRCSLTGYERPTTPVLDRLARNAIVCEQAVAPAAFTHITFPSIMTSTRPLSFGGYDKGIFDRPPSLFEVFHGAGYETHALSTFQWVSPAQGYSRGIDNLSELFVLNTLPGAAIASLKSSLSAWHGGRLTDAEIVIAVTPVLNQLFDSLATYCDLRIRNRPADRRDFPDSRLVRSDYDYDRVAGIAARHRESFAADPIGYLRRHLHYVPQAHEWMSAEWHYARRPATMLKEGVLRLADRLVSAVSPQAGLLRSYRYKRYIDSDALANRIIRIVQAHKGERPFFIWTHMLDTHVPYCAGAGRRWYRETPDYLAALGYPREIDPSVAVAGKPASSEGWAAWSALYDAAVRYTDHQIGRVVSALEARGLLDNTIIAVCGDHGEELGEHGDISHHFRLYSHNVRVPMMFYRHGLDAQRSDALVDLLDLGPTLADLAGVEPAPGWRGASVASPEARRRRHQLLETFHGGNCLFEHRPLYMAVRDGRYNYMWKEYRDPTDRYSPAGPELYDVIADPAEKTNLYDPGLPLLRSFEPLIAARMRELPAMTEERIRAALPEPAAIHA